MLLRINGLRPSLQTTRPIKRAYSMTGAEKIEKGDTVAWNWGGSSIQGEVLYIFVD